MTVEIKTSGIEPLRQTFSHVARRLGGDKPASRYQEATFDLQSETNFHYRPLWEPEHALYDKARTRLQMKDWYAFKDPRQFYYGAYVLNRAKLQETAESNFDFVDKRGGLTSLPKGLARRIAAILLPLRHYEWGANQLNCQITMFGWGGAITQATMYTTMDRLGMAQYLSRIGLLLDGQTGSSLTHAKQAWMEDPNWQGLRRIVEDLLVEKDWFEVLVAQDVVLDGLLFPMVYGRFGAELSQQGASVVAMLTEFMDTWFAEHGKWVDATLKIAAGESAENKALLNGWVKKWRVRADEALAPLAKMIYFEDAKPALAEANAALDARLKKAGLDA